tara:strand:- start:1344 stop:1598 length:255 start_codon:yes stop_codon:yes gene_type:complete
MSWENLLKDSFGSNEGFNKLMLAAEIVREIKMAIEEGFSPAVVEGHELLTESVLERIEDDEKRLVKIADREMIDNLEILAELFR